MSFSHLRLDVGVLFVQGSDAVSFIDGLSTNRIPDRPGSAVRTVFTDRAAKVIAATTALVREEGVVLLVDQAAWDPLLEHLQPRRLGQNVSLMDLSTRNHVVYETGGKEPMEGTWVTVNGVTTARIHPDLSVHVIAGQPSSDAEEQPDAWLRWRITNRWPEHGLEITPKHHPYACGLGALVHENKGCFLGQEVLTRMRSRGKTGWVLIQGPLDDMPEGRVTSAFEGEGLAIVRTSEIQ